MAELFVISNPLKAQSTPFNTSRPNNPSRFDSEFLRHGSKSLIASPAIFPKINPNHFRKYLYNTMKVTLVPRRVVASNLECNTISPLHLAILSSPVPVHLIHELL